MADQSVVDLIASIGRRRHVSPMELKSAYETGLVESGLQNLSGGTGDSAGWRQERASLYPNPTNLQASINRYFDETGALKGKYSRAGDLAAAVQRPRADLRGKYQARSADADSLLAQLGGGTGGGTGPTNISATVPQAGSSFDPGAQASPSLAGLLTQPQQPPVQVPVAPHAAIQSPVVSQAPQDPGISGLLQAIQTPSQDLPTTQPGSARVPGGPTASAASVRGTGTVRVAPGANAAGRGLTPGIQKVLGAVAAVAGPITVGTGTNHDRLTVDGNVSDHFSGNAADLPTTPGQQNIRLGREALIAVGMPRAQAEKATGGIYNVPYGQHRRIQVIFNTSAGGDHHNHVHVGVTGVGR